MAKAKILIVDDEPYNIDYLEQELEDLEYETFSASNGPAALEKVAAASPDMILLDIMDGFQVLEQLKAHKAWHTIPVIVISALNDLGSVGLTNNYIARLHSRSNRFASLFFGLLDPAAGQLTYLNGGHKPPFIIGPDGVKTRLTPIGPVIGLIPNAGYKIQTIQLEPADLLLIVTDAHNPAEERFTHQRLSSLLSAPVPSASTILNTINTHLRNFIADAIQFDDITMLAVQRQLIN